MLRKLTFTLFILLLLVISATACSKNPTVPPSEPDSAPSTNISQSESRNHILLGYYNLAFNTETFKIDVLPARNTELHLNLTNVMNGTAGLGIALVLAECDFPNGLVVFDMTLTHPLANHPEFTAFDMRGIMMTPGSLNVGDLVFADYNETRVENADGYSRWWNPTEFTTPGVFGYSDGAVANGTPAQLTATVNPYKIFADILDPISNLENLSYTPITDPQGRAVFSSGESNTRRYYMRFEMNPTIQLIYGYAIDCSWDLPDPNPPIDIPSDFPMEANCNEPFRIGFSPILNHLYYDDESGVGGGVLRLQINIHDWQGIYSGSIIDEIASITLMSPDLLTATVIPTLQSDDGVKAVFFADLTGLAVPSRSGINQLICEVVSSDGSTYKQAVPPAPEVPVAAYNVYALDIPNPECAGDANNDWNEATEIQFGTPELNQVCLQNDYKDFFYFNLPPGYNITGGITLYCDAQPTTLGFYDESQSLISETTISSGVASITLEILDLLPGKYYIRVLTANDLQVAPYVLELSGELLDVTPSNPVEITPDELFCNPLRVFYHENYLYLTGYTGVWVYDVTDPASPTLVSRSDFNTSYDSCFSYPYFYYTDWINITDWGINMIDFTDPTAPVNYEFVLEFPGEQLDIVQMNSTHLYLGTEGVPDSDIYIYDYATSPTAPVELNMFTITGKAQILELMDPEGPDTKLIVGTWNDIFTFNVENPLSVTPTGSYNFASGAPRCIVADGNYFYVGQITTPDGDGFLHVFYQGASSIGHSGSVDIPGLASYIDIQWPYVYLGAGLEGMTICNVTNANIPTHVTTTNLISSGDDLTVDGNYVYIIPRDSGMQIMDISTPAMPVPVKRLEVINHAYSMVQKDDYMIVAELGNGGFGAIKVLDISDPSNFTLAHEMFPGFQPNKIALSGNTLVAACQDKSWVLMDATDPLNIAVKHQKFESDYIYSIGVNGNALYVYVNDGSVTVRIYNITNLLSPIFEGLIPLANVTRAFSFLGNYMYITTGPSIEVFSITNPFNPTYMDSYSFSVSGYKDTTIQGDRLYTITYDLLEVVNISSPSAPVYMGSTALPEENNSFNALAVEGQFAYVTGWAERIVSVSLFPPDSPSVIGPVYDGTIHGGRDLEVHNGILYEGSSTWGLRIYDLY